MDEKYKRGLRKMARKTELRLAESLLRWKYKKEEEPAPHDEDLERHSRLIADQAHEIISRRGKNIWNELKKTYLKIKK
jgi:hypothetical protein